MRGRTRSVRCAAKRSRDGGFALIIVLWTLVLIALIVGRVVAAGRTELRIAVNLVDNAVTASAADGAVYQTIFTLLAPQPERRWALDGSEHELTIGDCRVGVRLTDEDGRINPNLAAPALLAALLRAVGSGPDAATQLATAIGEWIGAAGAAKSVATLAAEYRGAGLAYSPPGERMEDLSELRRVRGMTPSLYAAIRPHLSLFAPSLPVAAHADPVVAAAIAAVEPPVASTPNGATPQAAAATVTARIEVTAEGPGAARARRIAVARVSPATGIYTVLAWRTTGG